MTTWKGGRKVVKKISFLGLCCWAYSILVTALLMWEIVGLVNPFRMWLSPSELIGQGEFLYLVSWLPLSLVAWIPLVRSDYLPDVPIISTLCWPHIFSFITAILVQRYLINMQQPTPMVSDYQLLFFYFLIGEAVSIRSFMRASKRYRYSLEHGDAANKKIHLLTGRKSAS